MTRGNPLILAAVALMVSDPDMLRRAAGLPPRVRLPAGMPPLYTNARAPLVERVLPEGDRVQLDAAEAKRARRAAAALKARG